MIEIALFQPDIAPNTATILRLATCLGLKVTIIEPAGFVWGDSSFRRAGLDYLDRANLQRLASWQHFQAYSTKRRVVLVSTKAAQSFVEFRFSPQDILLFGRESSGVPAEIHASLADRVKIPMQRGERSINVSLACAMITTEALRQTHGFYAIT